MHCVLFIMCCVLCIMYFVLCDVYCVVCMVYCVLCCVFYCALCIMYCVLSQIAQTHNNNTPTNNVHTLRDLRLNHDNAREGVTPDRVEDWRYQALQFLSSLAVQEDPPEKGREAAKDGRI